MSLVAKVFYWCYYIFHNYLFSLENDNMESSKRCVKLVSLIFIIRCLTKSNLIQFIYLWHKLV